MNAASPALPSRRPTRFGFGNYAEERDRIVAEAPSGPRPCPSCSGRKVDRFGFDCTTCLGEGEVDE